LVKDAEECPEGQESRLGERSGTPPTCSPRPPARSATLLKDRVAHVRDFLDAVRRVADGGTALDPEVVAQLLVRRRDDPMGRLTPRELQVLQLMAEGRSNGGIVAVLRYLGP
jgi:hypothetical protein